MKNKTQKHGLSKTREYSIWTKMKERCYRVKNPNYPFYGGRGTFVCKRWKESFLSFFGDLGKSPSKDYTLDRINTYGSYTCGKHDKCEECKENNYIANCRWATKNQQDRNQRSCRYYTFEGKTLILKDWARTTGMDYITLWRRLDIGIPFEEAITLKPRSSESRKAYKKAKSLQSSISEEKSIEG